MTLWNFSWVFSKHLEKRVDDGHDWESPLSRCQEITGMSHCSTVFSNRSKLTTHLVRGMLLDWCGYISSCWRLRSRISSTSQAVKHWFLYSSVSTLDTDFVHSYLSSCSESPSTSRCWSIEWGFLSWSEDDITDLPEFSFRLSRRSKNLCDWSTILSSFESLLSCCRFVWD